MPSTTVGPPLRRREFRVPVQSVMSIPSRRSGWTTVEPHAVVAGHASGIILIQLRSDLIQSAAPATLHGF